MTIRVAINGYGRIGRNILRAHYESGKKHELQFVAINDLGNAQTNAHLTRYDTTHGKFPGTIAVEGESMIVNGDRIRVCAKRDPAELPWKDLKVDVVLECTGLFTSKEKASAHLAAGAKKVVLSAPGEKDVDRTVVVGVMTTVHAYTNDQVLTDVYHKDLRRARSATHNMIPASSGAAAAIGLVLPHLNGKLDGYAFRVPTLNVSIVDLTFVAKKPTTVGAVNDAARQASQTDLSGILEYNTEPLVSSDFNHNAASSVFDATLTRVSNGTLVKVSSWYDNEWGFSNRMLDATVALMNAK